MQVKERVGRMFGHWKFDIYDGDPERRPLTPLQARENELFAKVFKDAPFPLHFGQIVSRPIDTYEGDNLVVNTGKGLILDRLFGLGAPPSAMSHMGVGASATAAGVGDTGLITTPFIKPFNGLPTRAGLVVTAITTYLQGDAGSNINWQELAMFNGPTNGSSIMLNRIAPIGPFNKTAAVAIDVTVSLTQG